MSRCDEIKELLHGYLDEELPQFKAQLVENHIDECARCAASLEEYRNLKGEVKAMRFQQPTPAEWDQTRPPLAVRTTRGIGWLLFIAGLAAVTIFGAYEFTVDPGVKAVEKVTVLAVVLGIVFLFVSVLHERIRASKTDKYKEIER